MNRISTLILAAVSITATAPAMAQIVHNGDVSTVGSQCVGQDCANSESYGFDTLRLKENNLRIHFDDTSNTASFAANDWRIVANDSANGGANFLAVEDATAGRRIATFTAGAPANSLFVNSQGNMGLGTATPVVEIHSVDGNTPTLRLEQDGTSGFTPQTWDVAGNEAGFFVRDVNHGSSLPFRILPESDTNFLTISPDGLNVGDGTTADATLHVRRSQDAQLLVQNTHTSFLPKTLLKLSNHGNVKFELEEVNSGVGWAFTNSGTDFRISRQGSGEIEFLMSNSGDLTIAGALTENSDVNAKQAFVTLEPEAVLEKLEALPITQWQYKDAPGVNHVGPMAQDFHAAFGLGKSATGISTLDTAGIALAGIKALIERNDRLEQENRIMADRIRSLESQQAEIRATMTTLLERDETRTLPVKMAPN